VDIPHTVKQLAPAYFDERDYQIVSAYYKEFILDDITARKRVTLRFEGAAVSCEIYCNTIPCGGHAGGYTPFEIDLTPYTRPGTNGILVKLDGREDAAVPPFGDVVDYLCLAGIYREVSLVITDESYISDVFMRSESLLTDTPKLIASVEVNAPSGTLTAEVFYGKRKVFSGVLPASEKVEFTAEMRGALLWDLDNPRLYDVTVTYRDGDGVVIDVFNGKLGFREAVFKADGFFLNGKKIKLRGLNRHQCYPYAGYAMPKSAQVSDVRILKDKLGCNIVRSSHYPPSKHFIEACDALGLLVFEEIPGWQHIGDDAWRKRSLENVRAMILRDRNNPSVVLWGVRINESPDNDAFYAETNAVARGLDLTRQTGGVRNFSFSRFFEDVYTYNDFSFDGVGAPLLPKRRVTERSAPLLVTEYMGHMFPVKAADPENVRAEHAVRHAAVLSAAAASKDHVGCIGWCMADYPTHKDFGHQDGVCYHGVTDMFRMPKLAAAAYAMHYTRMPVLEVASSLVWGENPEDLPKAAPIFSNCDEIRVYRGGEYLETLYPKAAGVPGTVYFTDFFGPELANKEGMTKRRAARFRSVWRDVLKYGLRRLPFGTRVKLADKKFRSDAIACAVKYINMNGVYEFKGYQNGAHVCTVTKAPVRSKHLEFRADSVKLIHGKTYDVTRLTFRMLDESGNLLSAANDVVTVSAGAGLSVIGDAAVPLAGGVRAVWVRTTGVLTKSSVKCECNGVVQTIDVDIKSEE
jgi:beta-galactosidase